MVYRFAKAVLFVSILCLGNMAYGATQELSARTVLDEYVAKKTPKSEVAIVGGVYGAMAFEGGHPAFYATRAGEEIAVRPWNSRRLWKLRFSAGKTICSEKVEVSSAKATADEIRLHYRNVADTKIDVMVTLAWKEEQRRFVGRFSLVNRSKALEVSYFDFPEGFEAPIKSEGKFICPIWFGTGIPVNKDFKNETMVYPGHLFMQWVGLMQKGNSWLIHTEDPEAYTKFLTINRDTEDKDKLNLTFGHNVLVGPGQKYRCSYDTVITFLSDKDDWNTMAEIYGSWARKQWWAVGLDKKVRDRPQIERLKRGWTWLRGIPPIHETQWKIKVCMDYADSLDYMETFQARFGIKPMFWYTGWYGQFDGRLGDYFPVHPDLGDFKKFGDEVRKKDFFVSLHCNGYLRHPDNKNFDMKKMAKWKGKPYVHPLPHIGKGTVNYGGSPLAILPDDLPQYGKMMKDGGGQGLYLDVSGHAFAHDDNPNVRYPRKVSIGRNNWMVQKIEYYRAIRSKYPGLFIQTEGGNELLLDSVDCSSGGAMGSFMSMGRTPLPLQLMVYGDCEVYMPLFDGMGQSYNHMGWRWNGLWATAIQYPLRLRHVPSGGHWLYLMRRQAVVAEVMGKQMLKYRVRPDAKIANWKNGISIWNTSAVRDFSEATNFGEVAVRSMAKNGVTVVTSKGNCAGRGATSVAIDGAAVYESSNPSVGYVVADQKLMLSNMTQLLQTARIRVKKQSSDMVLIKKAGPFGYDEQVVTKTTGGMVEFEAAILPFQCTDYVWMTRPEAARYIAASAQRYLRYLSGDYTASDKADDVSPQVVLKTIKAMTSKAKKANGNTPTLLMDINLHVGAVPLYIDAYVVAGGKEHHVKSYFSYSGSRASFGVHRTLSADLSAFAGQEVELVFKVRSGGLKNYANRRVLHNVRISNASQKLATMTSLKSVGFIPKDAPLDKNVFEWRVNHHVSEDARLVPLARYVSALEALVEAE